jgi:hypothetical protein
LPTSPPLPSRETFTEPRLPWKTRALPWKERHAAGGDASGGHMELGDRGGVRCGWCQRPKSLLGGIEILCSHPK